MPFVSIYQLPGIFFYGKTEDSGIINNGRKI